MKNKIDLIAFLGVGLGILGVSDGAKAELAGKLTVEVQGLKDREGEVCVALFSSSQGFPNRSQNMVKGECIAIDRSPVMVTFDSIPFGNYAVAIYHDSNRDRELNKNLFGIPIEGFGFSNNAPARTSPARYGDAMFVLTGANTKIEILMRYL